MTDTPAPTAARCPVDHLSARKVERMLPPPAAIEQDTQGVWHIRHFEAARLILRGLQTKQAGFGAEFISTAVMGNVPILYAEGKPHIDQRRMTARFFTPKTVSTHYRQFMEAQVDQMLADFQAKRQADLSQMSLGLAIQTVARVVGLHYSHFAGMDRRLDRFFTTPSKAPRSELLKKIQQVWGLRIMIAFFLIDVKPAIAAHRRKPGENLISHLIEQKYTDREILTEAVTYAAAGMATTREFITMAAWHFLEQPKLRARYVAAGEEERFAMLHEILRVEPVVGHLLRTATADVDFEYEGHAYHIPAGARIDIDVYATNTEKHIVGEDPHAVCAVREIHGDQLQPMLMSFGDGHHRCPGAYIAIQETDMLLHRLLALETLHIAKPPVVTWGELSTGYELRQFMIAL